MNKLRTTVMLALLLIAIFVVTVAPAAAKVNEYEGQHRVTVVGDPSQWGRK